MSRYRIHFLLLLSATMVFMGVAFHYFGKNGKAFALTCLTGFVVIFLLQRLLCWNVPRSMRTRPPIPAGYHVLKHLGDLSSDVRKSVESGSLHKERPFGKASHRLYRQETNFPNGSWIAWTEVANQSVVAWALEFKSTQSPALNSWHGAGSGRLLGNEPV